MTVRMLRRRARERSEREPVGPRATDRFARLISVAGLFLSTGALVISYLNFVAARSDAFALTCQVALRSEAFRVFVADDSYPYVGIPYRCVAVNTGGRTLALEHVFQFNTALPEYTTDLRDHLKLSDGSEPKGPIELVRDASTVFVVYLQVPIDPDPYRTLAEMFPTGSGMLTDKILHELHWRAVDIETFLPGEGRPRCRSLTPHYLTVQVMTTRHIQQGSEVIVVAGRVTEEEAERLRVIDEL